MENRHPVGFVSLHPPYMTDFMDSLFMGNSLRNEDEIISPFVFDFEFLILIILLILIVRIMITIKIKITKWGSYFIPDPYHRAVIEWPFAGCVL